LALLERRVLISRTVFVVVAFMIRAFYLKKVFRFDLFRMGDE